MRNLITTLLDVLGICLVATGLVGYDWRIAAIVTGVCVLVISKLNA